jgi:hypothetical protein
MYLETSTLWTACFVAQSFDHLSAILYQFLPMAINYDKFSAKLLELLTILGGNKIIFMTKSRLKFMDIMGLQIYH